jgi:hypothetical protein
MFKATLLRYENQHPTLVSENNAAMLLGVKPANQVRRLIVTHNLPFTTIDGLFFYDRDDILQMAGSVGGVQ